MHEFIIETTIFISMKKISDFREKDQAKSLNVEDEKVYLKSIFQILENYMINCSDKNNTLVFNIIRIYCFFVNYDKDYSWMMMKLFINNDKKIFKIFLELITNESIPFKNVCFEKYLYFSLEDFEEEEKIKFIRDKYISFMIRIGEASKIVVRHKERIIKGAIYFIGVIY